MADLLPSEINRHDDTEELLPWYVTGQLQADERALVEQHLSACAHCRRQLELERRMIHAYGAMSPDIDSGWARLRRAIERRHGWRHTVGRSLSAAWRMISRPAVIAIGVAQLLFVIVSASILLSLARPSYHALGSAAAPPSANVIAMFRADTTEAQLRHVLRTSGASLAGGPTSADAYLLQVPARSREAALARLRADPQVLMAQPIDGPSS